MLANRNVSLSRYSKQNGDSTMHIAVVQFKGDLQVVQMLHVLGGDPYIKTSWEESDDDDDDEAAAGK